MKVSPNGPFGVVLLVLFFTAMFLFFLFLGLAISDDPADEAAGCFIVIDNAGREHRLEESPTFDTRVGAIAAPNGDWIFPSYVTSDAACLEAQPADERG